MRFIILKRVSFVIIIIFTCKYIIIYVYIHTHKIYCILYNNIIHSLCTVRLLDQCDLLWRTGKWHFSGKPRENAMDGWRVDLSIKIKGDRWKRRPERTSNAVRRPTLLLSPAKHINLDFTRRCCIGGWYDLRGV